MNPIQHRFCLSVVRSLKKMKDSVPFVRPVDPVALNIPHYPSIIKNPMDLSTVERKLGSSNPAKPDPNPSNPRYRNVDEFIADVRLIFSNALLFNGPDHAVTLMGKRVQDVFDKQLRQMPPADEPKLIAKPKSPTPPPPAVTKKPARRSSTTLPVIRRNEAETVSTRPKREIHPPPPKDLPYAEPPKKAMRKVRRTKDPSTMAQLQFCSKLLADLHKKQHYAIASPFYDPVDWVALNIPDYPKIVKKPMDMSTMRKKLDNHEYPNAQKFYDDFKLMIRNCFSFNPAGTPVNQAGIDLQRLFDDKWKSLPRRQETQDESELEDEEEDETDDERARQIAAMESQIEAMRNNLAAIKNGAVAGPKPKEKKKKEKREKYAPAAPVASTSKASKPKASAPAGGKKKSGGGGSKKTAAIADDDVLSFEQKKELSEAIGALDGTKLERVIQIIHEGVPEIRDSTEEIELEIDTLPAAVLTKLYNFVIRPLKAGPKRSRVPKGGGTGGLKRKSMDEDVEAEKIRQLEERMRLFEQGAEAPMPALPGIGHDSDASSDSSSDESSDSE
ncbi:Bromodomain-containing protein [Punctularia strigosozonata HHB-11173 SS5]|uniref:Bromodomain-containing protein n=1 Tax=Punctularia strigosozonata (strain HHB-11173) TaxID=741275 RepID=UPI0004418231|nr:Bromodomain-containing protein [Punctularia strigosozonata HHB-11173 SS5]EIN13579.1 Bromodomain-containing protein [Punctularia strigosozonata HHB-11173 SS5]